MKQQPHAAAEAGTKKHRLFFDGADRAEGCNLARSIGMSTMTGFTLLFMGSTLWQGLLLHNGMSSTEIGVLSSAGSLAQVAAMALNLFMTDRFKNPLLVMTMANLPMIVFFALISIFCFIGQKAFLFPVLLGCVILYYAAYGFHSIFAYKIPYITIRMEHYGTLTALQGLVSNLLCISVSMAIPFFLERVDYMKGMLILYIACTVCASLASYFNGSLKEINKMPPSDPVPMKELFSDPSVLGLAPANFLRGLSMGIIASLTLVAAEVFQLDSVALSLLVSLTTLGQVLGNLLFSVTGKPRWLSWLCLYSSLALVILGPLSAGLGSWAIFAVLFVLIQIAYALVNGTIPVMLAQFTPYRIIGGCTSLRMMETMAGSALSSWIVGLVLDHTDGSLPSVLLLLAAGLTQLCTGLAYHRYYMKERSARKH